MFRLHTSSTPEHDSRRHAADTPETLALPPPPATRASDPSRSQSRPLRHILVATDGTVASQGALVVAGLLARRDGATVHVVSAPPGSSDAAWRDDEPTRAQGADAMRVRHDCALAQAERVLGPSVDWTVSSLRADLAFTLAHVARVERPDLIVLRSAPALRGRTLRLSPPVVAAHHAGAPVLAVPPAWARLPQRALVGVGGGSGSIAAARAAARVVSGGAPSVRLLHVVPRFAPMRALRGDARADDAVARLDAAESAILAERGLRVGRLEVWGGDPATRLLDAAGDHVELIALGTRPPDRWSLWPAAGAASLVLRAAPACVLLARSGRADASRGGGA